MRLLKLLKQILRLSFLYLCSQSDAVVGGLEGGNGHCGSDKECDELGGVEDNVMLVEVLFTGSSVPMVESEETMAVDSFVLGDNVVLSETVSG